VLSQDISRLAPGKNCPAIDFYLDPTYIFSKKEIQDKMTEADDNKIEISPESGNKNGGTLYVFATTSLTDAGKNKMESLYLEYGFKYRIDKEVTVKLYASVSGKKLKNEEYKEKNIGLTRLGTKRSCMEHFKKHLYTVCSQAVTEDKLYKIALTNIVKETSSK